MFTKIPCIEVQFMKAHCSTAQRVKIGTKDIMQIGMVDKKEAYRQGRYIQRKNKPKRARIESGEGSKEGRK